MIYYTLFVSNLERASYRLDVATRWWGNADKYIIFCGNADDMVAAKRFEYAVNIEFVNLDIIIKSPPDIARMCNASMQWCWNDGAEWVMSSTADQCLTTKGVLAIQDYINIPGNVNYATFLSWNAQLYAQICCLHNGALVAHRSRPVKHVAGNAVMYEADMQSKPTNGMYTERSYINKDMDCLLGFDYLGVPQYKAKMYSHNYIWPDTYKTKWLNLYAKNPTAAIRLVYSMNDNRPLKVIDMNIYQDLIALLGLKDDFALCMSILPTA